MAKKKQKMAQAEPNQGTEVSKTTEPIADSKSKKKLIWLDHLRSQIRRRKVQVGAGVVLLVLIAGIVGAVVWQSKQTADGNQGNTQGTNKNNETAEVPLTAPRKIDGIMVATSDANNVPACVMIENAAFSGVRPQSGLSAASVVYEVIVEGGITRLMAVYAGEQADPVGPVRSARDTYLEFASEYNCAYVHAGGSYTAMNAIPQLSLRDIDGLRESKWFWRDNTKVSPHNLFTNTGNLYEAVSQGHSWTDAPTYQTWKFVNTDLVPPGEAATQVNIRFGGSYNVTYDYNPEGNYYERSNTGVAHTDANTGKTLTTRNIIIQHVPAGEFIEGKGRVNFSVTGEGTVEIIRQGVVTKGIWKKTGRLDRTLFYAEDGQEIPLTRGNTWIEIVPDGYSVDWQ